MNKMRRGFILTIFLCGLMVTSAPAVKALECAPPVSVEESFAKYDAIVLGYVKQIQSKPTGRQIEFQVMQSFKGAKPGPILLSDSGWSDLFAGVDAPDEQLYLLYLDDQNGKWEHPICAPSERSDTAGEELTFLLAAQGTTKEASVETIELGGRNKAAGVAWVIAASVGFIGSIVYLILLYRRPDL